MQRVAKVGVLSLGKVMGGAGLIMGLIFGAIYAVVFGLLGAAGVAQGDDEGFAALALAAGMCVGVPIFYGAISFVFGLLYALVLNLVFKYAGGLELEIQSD